MSIPQEQLDGGGSRNHEYIVSTVQLHGMTGILNRRIDRIGNLYTMHGLNPIHPVMLCPVLMISCW